MTGSIGNSVYTMEWETDGSRRFVRSGSRRELYSLHPLYEFALQADWGEYSGPITSRECEREETVERDRYIVSWKHRFFELQITYYMEETAVVKSMRLKAKKRFFLRYAQTEVSDSTLPLSRGGEGQPVFLGNEGFVSIVFPAGQNYFEGKRLRLEQAPYVELLPGEAFDFFRIVYGFCTEATLEESFRQYILEHKKRTPEGLRVYGDWGAHDELAGEKELDETLSLEMLSLLEKGKQSGVVFDYYLMDAFWFDRTGNYKTFLEKNWPEGPEGFLGELRKQEMKFGLWFDVNMNHLLMPGELLAEKGNGTGLCLGYGENTELLFQGIRTQMERCGCSLLKLDFADFQCAREGHAVHAPERTASKEPAVRNFIRQLEGLYKEYPHLLVAGYNGFTIDGDCMGSVDPWTEVLPVISPWWCLYLDFLYCGDPRPAEFPAASMGASLIWYTDAMIEKFDDSLIPLTAIDDHGTMIGNTNTIYYLGKEQLRDSWIMNITRGSKRELLYGDLSLLEEEDWKFLADSRELFAFVSNPLTDTRRIGGSPSRGEVYGYINSLGGRGYMTLVNPGSLAAIYHLPGEEWRNGGVRLHRIYYRKAFVQYEAGDTSDFQAGIRLEPGEVTVLAWERCNPVRAREGYLTLCPGASETILLSHGCEAFSLKLMDKEGHSVRMFGRGEGPLSVCCPGKTDPEPVCGRPLWSGCSWMVYRMHPDGRSAEDMRVCLRSLGTECLHVKWQEENTYRIERKHNEKGEI